jgi:hypothetical protein
MKKVIVLVALSIVCLVASRLAAEYGVAWNVRRPPATPGNLWDMKTIKLKWELIEWGFKWLGLGLLVAAAAAVVLQGRKIR